MDLLCLVRVETIIPGRQAVPVEFGKDNDEREACDIQEPVSPVLQEFVKRRDHAAHRNSVIVWITVVIPDVHTGARQLFELNEKKTTMNVKPGLPIQDKSVRLHPQSLPLDWQIQTNVVWGLVRCEHSECFRT